MFFIDETLESVNRYNVRKFCDFSEGLYDDMSSYFFEELRNIPSQGTYKIMVAECRPDIYSRDIYGTTMYWRLLLFYNDIVNLNQLTLGTILQYPSIADIESLYFRLKPLKAVQK